MTDYKEFYFTHVTVITISFTENFQVLDGLSFLSMSTYAIIILYVLHLTRGTSEDVQHSTVQIN